MRTLVEEAVEVGRRSCGRLVQFTEWSRCNKLSEMKDKSWPACLGL